MSTILNIETSSKNCSVCLSSNGELISSFDSEDITYKHRELLTSSIQNILNENNLSVKDLSAVSVGIGPGSFTGLRIGLSVAKGLCYSHNIDLIGISSLKIIANSVIKENKKEEKKVEVEIKKLEKDKVVSKKEIGNLKRKLTNSKKKTKKMQEVVDNDDIESAEDFLKKFKK